MDVPTMIIIFMAMVAFIFACGAIGSFMRGEHEAVKIGKPVVRFKDGVMDSYILVPQEMIDDPERLEEFQHGVAAYVAANPTP